MKKESDYSISTGQELISRLIEAEEILEAIKNNKIDALLISTNDGNQVYTLKDTDLPYRAILESMNEGAATFTEDGYILFANKKFCDLLNISPEIIPGTSIFKWVAISDLTGFDQIGGIVEIISNNGSEFIILVPVRIPFI